MGCDTYTEAFNFAIEDLKKGIDYGNSMIEYRYSIQKAFEMIKSKVAEINKEREIVDGDDGPENPLDFEAVEAANTMDDFQRINLVEVKQIDLESFIAKLNTDQKRVFDMITNKMDTTDSNADILRCFDNQESEVDEQVNTENSDDVNNDDNIAISGKSSQQPSTSTSNDMTPRNKVAEPAPAAKTSTSGT
ncbi:unnamed protein product [Parnassius apollo]|uniref:(apollo) hypothetical protein n=1 Tax=Parnassius apollo TaxID=110799 RepID=A0A8S3XLG0_PARAO|nr:unnamed protein product [Parnassius apollo]